MTSLTVGQLHDLAHLAKVTLIAQAEYGDETEACIQMEELEEFINDIIVSSHMGCAEDEVILELKDN